MIKESEVLQVYDLKTNFQSAPVIEEKEDIYFSWKLKANAPGIVQKQYRIRVLKKESTGSFSYVWDSGYQTTGNSVNIKYEGEKLLPESIYCWKLYICDSNNQISEQTSEYFYTGCNWKGVSWITSKENYPAVTFSAHYQLPKGKSISSAVLYVSALGIYHVCINHTDIGIQTDGNRIMLAPGWADYLQFIPYQCYDITHKIHGEELIVDAVIGNGWFSGKISRHSLYENLFEDKIRKKCFIAKIIITFEDGSRQTLQTSPGEWKYNENQQLIENDLYDGEVVNYLNKRSGEKKKAILPVFTEGQLAATNKLYPSNRAVVTADFHNAREPVTGFYYQPDNIIDISEAKPYGRLVRRETPVNQELLLESGYELILDFGQNAAAIFELEAETLEVATMLQLETGEMLNDGKSNPSVAGGGSDGPEFSLYQRNLSLPVGGECLSREKLILAGNSYYRYYPVFTYHGFRYIKISTDHTVKIKRVRQVPVTSAVKQTGYLKTNNQDINRLIENVLWS